MAAAPSPLGSPAASPPRPTGGPNLLRSAKQQWKAVAPLLTGAAVYLDDGAAEAVGASVGVAFLQSLGAAFIGDVRRPSPADAAIGKLLTGAVPSKAVLLTTRLLEEARSACTAVCMAHPQATQLMVLCSVSEPAHASYPGTMLGEHAYGQFVSMVQQDIAKAVSEATPRIPNPPEQIGRPPVVTVRHFPLPPCAITSSAFMLPAASFAAAAPRWEGGQSGWFPELSKRHSPEHAAESASAGAEDDEEEEEDAAAAGGLAVLADALAGLLGRLGAKPHVFALGPASQAVARELVSLPQPAKPPPHTAALVLVDRAKDVGTPALHGDHLLDRIFGLLPRAIRTMSVGGAAQPVQTRSVDPRVSGALNAEATPEGSEPDAANNPAASPLDGGMLHPADDQVHQMWRDRAVEGVRSGYEAVAWLAFLARKPERDAALFLRKWLREALRVEEVQAKLAFRPGQASASEFRGLSAALASAPAAPVRHASLLQYGRAAAAAAQGGPAAAHWEMMQREELQMVLAASEGPEAVMAQLLDLLRVATPPPPAKPPAITLRNVLQLTALGYSLASAATQAPFSEVDEQVFKGVLADALLRVADPKAHGLPWLSALQPQLTALQSCAPAERARREHSLRPQVEALAELVTARLRQITAMRKGTQAIYASHVPAKKPANTQADTGRPSLVGCMAEAIGRQRAVPGLRHVTDSLSGLFKSGLSRFGLQLEAPPQPAEHPLVVIFVLGGISMREVRDIQVMSDAWKTAGVRSTLMAGGTSLIAPQDVTEKLFDTIRMPA